MRGSWITEADLDGVLAHSEGVPQLDGFIPRARHDLAIISREGYTQDIFGVTDKAASRRAAGGTKQKDQNMTHNTKQRAVKR